MQLRTEPTVRVRGASGRRPVPLACRRGSLPHGLSNDCRRTSRVFVLPDSDHDPSSVAQRGRYQLVASAVPLQFRSPVLGVGLGSGSVCWAPVPEAAVHEHGDLQAWEEEIWPHCDPASDHSALTSITETEPMDGSAHRELWLRVSLAVGPHDVAGSRARRGRRLW
jgi:hypothetical protein